MYRKFIPFMVAIVSMTSASAQAADVAASATLTLVEGSVLVNQGKRFVPARLGTALMPGDRVLALKTGQAMVTFLDGCAILVQAGKLTTVGRHSPCDGSSTQAEEESSGLLGGDTIPQSNDHRPPYKTPPRDGLWVPGLVVGATGLAIGGSCLADGWPCDDDHRRNSVSP